jgi:hypothetical protein
MGLSLKGILKGVKKAASIANPLAGAGYDLIGGKSVKDTVQRAGDNFVTGAKGALAAAPLALTGGAAAPALGGAAGAAGGGSVLGSIGSFFGSSGGQALLGAAGGVAKGVADSRSQKRELDQNKSQFDAQQGLRVNADNREQGAYDATMRGREQTSPMRSQLIQALMQRFLGNGAGTMMPNGPTQATMPSLPPPPMQNAQPSGAPQLDPAILQKLQAFFR